MTSHRRATAILTFLGLGIGAGLWALLAVPPAQHRAVALDREAASRSSGSAAEADSMTAAGLEDGLQGTALAARSVVETDPSAGRPVAEEPGPPGPQLIARVIDGAGAPIEGALFLASTDRSEAPLGFDLGPSDRRDVCESVSGPLGRVTIAPPGETPRLAPGRDLAVFVRAAGFAATRPPSVRMTSEAPHDFGDIALPPGARAAGRVLGPDGLPAVGARITFGQPDARGAVSVRMPGRGLPLPPTDDRGRFACSELRPGAFYILVETDTSPTAIAYGEADALAPVEDLLIQLDRGHVIAGRLEGAPTGLDLAVVARRTDDSDPSAVERRPRYAPIDPQGAFRADGFSADASYRLAVVVLPMDGVDAVRAGVAREVEPVTVPSGTTDAALEWNTRASLRGRVVAQSADGTVPVESYVIWQAEGSPEGSDFDANVLEESGEPKVRHPEGRFAFDGLGVERGGTREMTLRVRAVGFEELIVRGVSVPHAETVELGDLVLGPAPSWSVTVVDDATDAPIRDARVFAARASNDRAFRYWWRLDQPAWSSDSMRFGETGERGTATLMLPSGGAPYQLGVRADGYAPSEVLELASPDPLVVRLDRGATVDVRVIAEEGTPAAGVDVTLASADRNAPAPIRLTRQSDAEGRVLFTSIPGGRHNVSTSPPSMRPRRPRSWGESRTRITTSRGETVEVTLQTPASVRVAGIVRQSGVPLAGARVSFEIRERGELLRPEWDAAELRAITGGGGRFELEHVPLAEYEVVVLHGARSMATRIPVKVRPNLADLVIDLPDASVSGRVVLRGSGESVGGIQVAIGDRAGEARAFVGERVLYESENGRVRRDDRWNEPGKARSGRDGQFSFEGVATGVPIQLTVADGMIRTRTVQLGFLEPGQRRRDVVVEVDAAGAIDITFERSPSAGRRDRTLVRAWRLDKNGRRRGSRAREAEGSRSVRLESLSPGRYSVETFDAAERRNPGATALDTRELTVVAFERTRARMRGK